MGSDRTMLYTAAIFLLQIDWWEKQITLDINSFYPHQSDGNLLSLNYSSKFLSNHETL